MSSSKKCCVSGCDSSGRSHKVLHGFPNPKTDENRYHAWKSAVGSNILEMDNEYVYRNRRVCHLHFENKYCCRNNRISNIAIPTLYISGSNEAGISNPLQEIQNLASFTQFIPDGSNDVRPECFQLHSEPRSSGIASSPMLTASNVIQPEHVQLVSVPRYSGNVSSPMLTGLSIKEKSHLKLKKNKKIVKMTNTEENLYKKIRALQLKLWRCKNREKINMATLKAASNIISNPQFTQAMSRFSSTAKIVTLLQFKQIKKKAKGRRFDLKEKIIALSIYKQSPKAYRFLRKHFILPSPQILSKLISEANIKPGINEKIFNQLKKKTMKMTTKQKLCSVVFDEISLSPGLHYSEKKDRLSGLVTDGERQKAELADHCLVFMIKGIMKNYKQPIAYTFCHGSTKKIQLSLQIKEVIRNLRAAGFIPVATVCDQGASNQSAINKLITETKNAHIKRGEDIRNEVFEVDGEEIIPLYDTPHLIKGIRNNLINKNLKYTIDGKHGIAKWEHLRLLYEENPAYKGIRLLPKLTDHHIIPEKIAKMKVKYATQVFSATVSANMGYLADKEILPKEAKETADILIFFDQLFDSVNGSFKKNKFAKPLLGPVTPKSVHHKTWGDSIKILKSMKFVGPTAKNETPSLKNWIKTIEGLEYLTKKMEKEYEITSLWMRHFNQDCLENFFGAIRSHGCRNTNPTATAFESAYSTLLINNLSSAHAPGANCEEEDVSDALINIFEEKNEEINIPNVVNMDHVNVELMTINEKKKDPKIIASLTYIAGYIARQAKRKIFKGCKICYDAMISGTSEYIRRREYGLGWLFSPSETLLSIVSDIQDIIYNMKNDFIQSNIKNYIKTICLIVIDFNTLNCKKHLNLKNFILDLSVRFFLHNYCKDINNIIKGKRKFQDTENDDMLKIKAKKLCIRHNNKQK